MADLNLAYDASARRYDLVLDGAAQPALDLGLKTAAITAVLSWGRAREGYPLPGFDADRKGHWADPWADGGRKGSRIWLLNGRVLTPRTIADAKAYLEEALAPMVAKGRIREAIVTTWRSGPTRIAAAAVLVHLDGATETVEFEDLASA